MRLQFLTHLLNSVSALAQPARICCADILRPAIAMALPAGWELRLHPVEGYNNVFALDVYFRNKIPTPALRFPWF